MDRAGALAVVDRALSKFPELRRVRCGSPVHVSWVQTTTMDLSWRARRPGDRQCARSSNLSRRWRLRQQCRHSTLGSAGSRVKTVHETGSSPEGAARPPPIAPRPSWTCHSRQLQSTISLRWTSSEAMTRQNEAAFLLHRFMAGALAPRCYGRSQDQLGLASAAAVVGMRPCARRHESATRRRAISWATPRVGRLESPVTGSIVWDPLIGVLGRRYPQMKAIGLNWR